MTNAIAHFDYQQVSKEQKSKLICLAGQFMAAKRSFTKAAMDAGEIVASAHEILAGTGRDGMFSAWVESECGVSRRTAYNYMYAWRTFGKRASIAHLFEDSALYLLAAPSAPQPAVAEAIRLADKGEAINQELARKLIAKHCLPHEASPEPPTTIVANTKAAPAEPDPANFYQLGGDDESEEEADEEPTVLAEEPPRPSETRKALKAAQDSYLALSVAERISFKDWLEDIEA